MTAADVVGQRLEKCTKRAEHYWDNRQSAFWTVNGWISTGIRTYEVPIKITAPSTPCDYHVVIAFYGAYTAEQVASCTHAGFNSVWDNGSDVGFDWTSVQFAEALGQTGRVNQRLWTPPDFLSLDLPATAVRIRVEWTRARGISESAFFADKQLLLVASESLPRWFVGYIGTDAFALHESP